MPTDYTQFNPQIYTGSKVGKLITLGKKSLYPPKVITIEIPWSSYPSGCVTLDLQAGGGAGGVIDPIDLIKSVYIDNRGNNTASTVQFPDTMFAATALPNGIISSQVITFQSRVYIFLEGPVSLANVTRVYLANFLLDPYTQEQAPTSISLLQGTSPDQFSNSFPPEGAGESYAAYSYDCSGNASMQVFNSPKPNGAFVVNQLHVSTFGIYLPNAYTIPIRVELYGILTGTIYFFDFYAYNDLTNFNTVLYREKTGQLKLNAQDFYFLQNPFSSNVCSGYLNVEIYWDWWASSAF